MFGKKPLQFVWIPLCLLLSVLFLLLTVMALKPVPTSALKITEEFSVSASPKNSDRENPIYICQLTGTLFNPTEEEIVLGEVRFSMKGAGDVSEEYVCKNITVPVRSAHTVFVEWESEKRPDRVIEIRAVDADGNEKDIQNGSRINGLVILFALLTVASILVTVYLFKQRAYAAEEERMK